MEYEPIPLLQKPIPRELIGAPKFVVPGKKGLFFIFLVGVVLFTVVYRIFIAVPSDFPKQTIIEVPQGGTLSGITSLLREREIVRSSFAFKSLVVLFGGSRGIQAGDYYFDIRENAVTVAWRLTHADYNLKPIKITIPEGTNSQEIARIIVKNGNFTHFKSAEFMKLAAPYEGYLFPDTYLLLPNSNAQAVLDLMLANYRKRIELLADDIKAFGRPISDVMKMASIIEEEARTEETRRTIAGILWKRFDQGMLLQVDAAFAFVNGKYASKDLTLDDLKIDSPYNTYVHKGLPPTPISNPGIDTIRATVNPLKTAYYFYLSDAQGNMHYAVTHDGHVENKFKYLK